jgi:AraC-like DNA-binding protein
MEKDCAEIKLQDKRPGGTMKGNSSRGCQNVFPDFWGSFQGYSLPGVLFEWNRQGQNVYNNSFPTEDMMIRAAIIKEIIEKNRGNYQFTVYQLANEMGISYSYLYEMIYKGFGMSPQQLIETVRLEEAIRLIASGKKLIKIYRRLGYDNIRTFQVAFLKRFNMNYSTCRSSLVEKSAEERNREVHRYIDNLWTIGDF